MKRIIVESCIADKLSKATKGKIFFVDDFLNYGNSESVKKALFRLNDKKILVRIAHGIYLYPKIDKELGILFPSTEEIAKAIARRDKAQIAPTGIQALNNLGLSTQVPMKIVYLTDGTARTIKIGKRTITFKKVSPKNFMTKGEISSQIISALKTIGQSKIDNDLLNKIQKLLIKETTENILHDAKLAPAWINKILTQITQCKPLG